MIEATTDVSLRGETWANICDRLRNTVFSSYWQIYALCISIGIMYDEQAEFDSNETRTVPRTVLNHPNNNSLLDFLFQTAILTSRKVDLSEEQRLELAFAEEQTIDFNKLSFLTSFANFGIKKIQEITEDKNDLESMESIMTFLNDSYENGIMPTLELELE